MKKTFFLFVICAGITTAADLNIVPDFLNTGVSNITTTFTITTPTAAATPWTAVTDFGTNPAWFALSVTSGTVYSFSANSIPVTIYRNKLPLLGTYTGFVFVMGTDISKTVTVTTTITEFNNGLFPKINGDSRAFAGKSFDLNAQNSVGFGCTYYWVTNYNSGLPIAPQSIMTGPSGIVIFNEVDEFDLSLVSEDEHERKTIESRKKFQVWNLPPTVNAGGPYIAESGETITVIANGMDPNPDEKLVYSWQFNPPYGPFSEPSSSPTATFVYSSSIDSYIVCVVSDTWTGVEGTYNAPLGAIAIAQILIENQPPIVEVAYLSNSVWSALSNYHEIHAVKLPTDGFAMKAYPTDPDNSLEDLTVEWRENPENPVHNLISENDITNLQVTLGRLSQPGTYKFSVVANDGEHSGKQAEICIKTPGIKCKVIADGFQAIMPVWGTQSSANPANTNEYGNPDITASTRSDINGWMYLDRPQKSQCFVEIERTVNGTENEISNYFFFTSIETNIISYPVFSFPVSKYIYAGRIVNENNFNSGVSNASATLVIRDSRIDVNCNSAGGYSFGDLPKPWPVDNENTGSYYIVFLKDGWTSLCLKKTPSQIMANSINDLHTLKKTNAVISINGIVRSSESGLPVGNGKIWFGNRMIITDELGSFVFTNLPLPMIVPNSPSHVLIAEADGYSPTKNIYNNTSTGGTVDVYIDGGEAYYYGNIIDALTGEMITDGTIETPIETSVLSFNEIYNQKTFTNQIYKINKSGYFNIRVPGGCNYITINANGEQQQILLSRNITGTQPIKNDIQLIPEPTYFFTIIIFFGIINIKKIWA